MILRPLVWSAEFPLRYSRANFMRLEAIVAQVALQISSSPIQARFVS